jgi:hypothetical protein
MKLKIFCLLTVSSMLYCQSNIVYGTGTTIDVGSGADVCADAVIINGTHTGVGTFCNAPLPIELVSFNAIMVNDKVELNWQTATEFNNYGFEIEREVTGISSQNSEWEKVGFVKGAGNSNSVRNYSFVDNSVSYGSYLYRLKQLDKDGNYKYSSVVDVNAGQIPNDFVLNQNYPNPFNPSTRIQFGVNKNTHASLIVYNIIGSEVVTLFNGDVTAGQIYDVTFNGNNLASGIYYYKLLTNEKTAVKKMLLMK